MRERSEMTRVKAIRAILDSVYGILPPKNKYGGISRNQAEFLASLIIDLRPKRIVEVGTASGISASVILKALEYSELSDSEFYSLEYLDHCYFDPSRKPGFIIDDVFQKIPSNFHLHLQKSVSDLGKVLGEKKADFIFIDGNHSHPWVVFDTICTLPFLENDSTVVYHDINLHLLGDTRKLNEYGAHVCYYGLPASQKIAIGELTPNIGSLCLTGSPIDFLPSLLEILYSVPWKPSAWPELNINNLALPLKIIEQNGGLEAKARVLQLLGKALNCV